jgi:hypothetical protein
MAIRKRWLESLFGFEKPFVPDWTKGRPHDTTQPQNDPEFTFSDGSTAKDYSELAKQKNQSQIPPRSKKNPLVAFCSGFTQGWRTCKKQNNSPSDAVAASEPLKPASEKSKSGDGCGCVILAIIALAIIATIWFICPDSWTDPIWYSFKHDVDISQVHYNDKPKDCDFIHAPLGDKGCHYKKIVKGFNAAGELIAGDDAPVYSQDETGKPIVSYDRQKTWKLMPEGEKIPDAKVSEIEINWVKVSD